MACTSPNGSVVGAVSSRSLEVRSSHRQPWGARLSEDLIGFRSPCQYHGPIAGQVRTPAFELHRAHTFVVLEAGATAPEAERWETLWHYMQSGPGVFKGDLYFYKVDGDIRDRVDEIDVKRCPL